MPDRRPTTRQTHPDDASPADLARLAVVALVAMPIAGMLAALATLDVTRSFPAHVAMAAALPAVGVTLAARRFGAPPWLVLRLALMAALLAVVLLDLGWSGAAG